MSGPRSITLQKEDGIAISSHSDGVVRVLDILTGLCKASFQTPAKDSHQIDTHLADGKVITVWHRDEKICIWDTEKGELLRTAETPRDKIIDFRISGDGSKVFCLYGGFIRAWSTWTGDLVGEVRFWCHIPNNSFLTIDGLRVWVHSPPTNTILGWDFGILESPPIELPDISQNLPHLYFVGGIRQLKSFLPGIQDTVTKKVVFQLPGRLARCSDAQWDGQYLVAGYDSGEMLILECNYVPH